jgi:hypothetical protein
MDKIEYELGEVSDQLALLNLTMATFLAASISEDRYASYLKSAGELVQELGED